MTSAAITHDESERRHPREWSPWAAALVAFAIYACTLGGTYIYDDIEVIRNDPRIANPSLWGQYFTQQYMLGRSDKLFRPLVSLSFAIEWWLHGDRPWLFHLVNVLLHAGASAAVAFLGLRVGGRRVGWIAGLLFAVHPVHVEAVAGLVGRSELACTLATVGGLNLFLRRPLSGWGVLAIGGCFWAALLSKEQGLLFPLILLTAVPLRKTIAPPTSDNKSIKWLALLLCASLVLYIQWRERLLGFYWDRYFLDWEFNPLVRSRGMDRILMPVVLLGHYTALLVAPWKLSIDYGAMVIGWQARPRDPYLWLGAIALVAWLILFVVTLRRRDRAMFFCLIGLALTYGMVANVLALIGTNLAERLMYLPSAFFVLMIAMGLGTFHRAAANLVIGLLVALGAARSVTYADQWNNRLEFYQTTSARQTRSIRGYVLLYSEYTSLGQWQQAREVGARATAALPMCWEAHAMCVEADLRLGEADRALQDADVGLRDCPNDRGLIGWKQEALKRLRARR